MAVASADVLDTTGVPRPAQMTPVRLRVLAALSGAELVGTDVTVSGVSSASASVRVGDLFAGLPGATAHGARFAADAVAAGAVAILTDPLGAALLPRGVPALVVPDVRAVLGEVSAEVYDRPALSMSMLGVTGTSGKTTTTFLIRAGLTAAGVISGLIGTVATLIGEDSVKTGFTTPEAADLQALLAVMRERGAKAVTMEVSSHALAMGRVEAVPFTVGAFTNLSRDHLDFHPDMQSYFAAKARLFDGRSRREVAMIDDEWGRRLVRAGTVTVSTQGPATWQAVDVRTGSGGGTRFTALGPDIAVEAGCAVPGSYNVANALLALAVLDGAGVPAALAAPAVATATVPGRMERIEAGQPFLAVVDYSHKPAAVEGALRALRPFATGRLVIVLGCGGDRDRDKRPLMGEVAARGADLVIVTDDNPRSEEPSVIRAAVLAGARSVPGVDVREIGDRAEAIAAAVLDARAGDVVLIAGKGHETGQEAGGTVRAFDDRDVLRAALQGVHR